MDKPEWFEQIEHRILVRNFLQNEYALHPPDASSAVKNALIFSEWSKRASEYQALFEKSDQERKILQEKIYQLEHGPDNIYEVRRERDQYKASMEQYQTEYQKAKLEAYTAKMNFQPRFSDGENEEERAASTT